MPMFFLLDLDRLKNECDILNKEMAKLKLIVEQPLEKSEDQIQSLIDNFQNDQRKKKSQLNEVRLFTSIDFNGLLFFHLVGKTSNEIGK